MPLLRSAPYFPVADVEKTASYYEEVLGFQREYVAGSPPVFAILSREGHPLMLRLVPNPDAIRPNEAQGGSWDVFYWVANLDALHAELKSKGAEIAYGPVFQASYNMNEFAIRDPNGYILGFGEPAEVPAAAKDR